MKEAREVEDVGPEEDSAGGACTERETEEPLERGLGPVPEPPRLFDFRGGGEQNSGEDGGGDEGHGEEMDRR